VAKLSKVLLLLFRTGAHAAVKVKEEQEPRRDL
jgi:hypothetical protein